MVAESWNRKCAMLTGFLSVAKRPKLRRASHGFLFSIGGIWGSSIYRMSQGVSSIAKVFAPHRILRLRRRYIFTKKNHLRLRYSAGLVAIGAAAFWTLTGHSDSSQAFITANYDPVPAIAAEPAAPEILATEMAVLAAPEISGEDAAAQEGSPSLPERIALNMAKAREAIEKARPPEPQEKVIEVGSGDTVAGVLQDSGVSGADAYRIVEAMKAYFDPRKVKPGQSLALRFDPAGEGYQLAQLKMKIDPVKEVIVRKEEAEKYSAAIHEKEVRQITYAQAASIETSLYASAMQAGIPASVIAEVIRIYSWDVDFQRDIRQGDKIEILYDSYRTEDGDFARHGDVLYANLTVGGREVPVYRYEMNNGDVDYFEEDGHSIRKALMKTPVDGARLSSGFGMRKHPVLGYNKMHKGLDFAAPIGTPIYAAGDGTIEVAGRNGSYGNYVRLRHNSSLKTAYAHMHKFGKGISAGKRVKQGEVIGYIGTTGRSTGPHLHYEVHVDGRQVNPKSVDLPTGEQLKGSDMEKFRSAMKELRRRYDEMAEGIKLAQAN